jgi:hypothetical protein
MTVKSFERFKTSCEKESAPAALVKSNTLRVALWLEFLNREGKAT